CAARTEQPRNGNGAPLVHGRCLMRQVSWALSLHRVDLQISPPRHWRLGGRSASGEHTRAAMKVVVEADHFSLSPPLPSFLTFPMSACPPSFPCTCPPHTTSHPPSPKR